MAALCEFERDLIRERTAAGLNLMRKWCRDAGLEECTGHGLRKALARRLAESGCTPHLIASITGHKSEKEVAHYTEAADRAGLADVGMAKIVANKSNVSHLNKKNNDISDV